MAIRSTKRGLSNTFLDSDVSLASSAIEKKLIEEYKNDPINFRHKNNYNNYHYECFLIGMTIGDVLRNMELGITLSEIHGVDSFELYILPATDIHTNNSSSIL